jgi:exopolyphosphatase/guanosine-5'-triphosphate,3'-diphosphate pyrophosphatase
VTLRSAHASLRSTHASLRSTIDLGTNTCLLLIAEWDERTRTVKRVVSDHSTVVRLGQGVDRARSLAPEAMERTRACLARYAAIVTQAGLKPSETVAVATSQARDASNGASFFHDIRQELGFEFRTISGDEEARYTFIGGLLPGMVPESSVVIDIGGGSTELMSAQGGQSVDVGSVRFTERYLKSDPVTDEEFWACQEEVDRLFAPLRPWREKLPPRVQLVAVAGTATTLAAWHLGLDAFDAERINEVTLTRGDVHRMVEELKWRTVQERLQLPGIEAGRADVLLAGSLTLWRAMEVVGFRDARISTRGLRFGVLSMPDPGSS